jgi:hypothetical protein
MIVSIALNDMVVAKYVKIKHVPNVIKLLNLSQPHKIISVFALILLFQLMAVDNVNFVKI